MVIKAQIKPGSLSGLGAQTKENCRGNRDVFWRTWKMRKTIREMRSTANEIFKHGF